MTMRPRLLVAALFLALIAFGHRANAQPPRAADDDPLRHGHALLIGNSHYQDSRWARLDDVPLQLDALKRGLQTHFDTVDVKQNLDSDSLRQTIDGFLRTYGNDSNARLFIYYAG